MSNDQTKPMINNVEEMRKRTLEMLDKLFRREVKIEEAKAIADVCNSVMASVKLQAFYAHQRGESAYIPFLHDVHQGTPLPNKKQPTQLLDGIVDAEPTTSSK